jgi:hypothetical protein
LDLSSQKENNYFQNYLHNYFLTALPSLDMIFVTIHSSFA